MMVITGCRSCNAPSLMPIVSLGNQPPANALLKKEQLSQHESKYPLDLVFCPQCSLVQITTTVPPNELFRDYHYFSSFADTTIEHARRHVIKIIDACKLDEQNLVVELASNDGYLLQFYKQRGIPVLGIDPAENVAKIAEKERGIPTITRFFTKQLAEDIASDRGQADVIHANNVLAHVADLCDFTAGISILLKSSGIAVLEIPYVRNTIESMEFDTIYHEHLCYFSLTSLVRVFDRVGLVVTDVEHLPIHGGSLRITAHHPGKAQQSSTVNQMLQSERNLGMDKPAFYLDFAERIEQHCAELHDLLKQIRARGRTIAAYGASAKGSTLLNLMKIDQDMLNFVADRSQFKQGRYLPGSHVPIVAPSVIGGMKPDYLLLLAWNYREEILYQLREFRAGGGKVIIPIPKIEIV